ncbi:MAG: hypothetical protein GY898_22855 [Proteobacteria bacterium]|nr:hypothetical protein [Pseudomonadota bacterium]
MVAVLGRRASHAPPELPVWPDSEAGLRKLVTREPATAMEYVDRELAARRAAAWWILRGFHSPASTSLEASRQASAALAERGTVEASIRARARLAGAEFASGEASRTRFRALVDDPFVGARARLFLAQAQADDGAAPHALLDVLTGAPFDGLDPAETLLALSAVQDAHLASGELEAARDAAKEVVSAADRALAAGAPQADEIMWFKERSLVAIVLLFRALGDESVSRASEHAATWAVRQIRAMRLMGPLAGATIEVARSDPWAEAGTGDPAGQALLRELEAAADELRADEARDDRLAAVRLHLATAEEQAGDGPEAPLWSAARACVAAASGLSDEVTAATERIRARAEDGSPWFAANESSAEAWSNLWLALDLIDALAVVEPSPLRDAECPP